MASEQPDRTEQGSTADYCSRWPGEPHATTTHMRGGALVSVRRCSACGWIDFSDLDEQVRDRIGEARKLGYGRGFEAGIAEGRRQAATDVRAFAERRHAVMLADGSPERHAVMGAYGLAADVAETGLPPGTDQEKALGRLVGPWEPAPEQPEHRTEAPRESFEGFITHSGHASPHCACGINGAGQMYVDPICQRKHISDMEATT